MKPPHGALVPQDPAGPARWRKGRWRKGRWHDGPFRTQQACIMLTRRASEPGRPLCQRVRLAMACRAARRQVAPGAAVCGWPEDHVNAGGSGATAAHAAAND